MYSICQDPTHFVEQCQFMNSEQVSVVYERNDPYSQTYNPRWRNHPNFSWSQGQNYQNQNYQNQKFQNSNFQKPQFQSNQQFSNNRSQNPYFPQNTQISQNAPFTQNQTALPQNEIDKRVSSLEKRIESLTRSVQQNTNVNAQAIARLETQIEQLGNQLNGREK